MNPRHEKQKEGGIRITHKHDTILRTQADYQQDRMVSQMSETRREREKEKTITICSIAHTFL